MSIHGEIGMYCDGESTLDALFRYGDESGCHLMLGAEELGGPEGMEDIEHGNFQLAERRLRERAGAAGWEQVAIPPLPRALEELWDTTGGRTGHLCPACRKILRTRPRDRPLTAWDRWTPADIARRAAELERSAATEPAPDASRKPRDAP